VHPAGGSGRSRRREHRTCDAAGGGVEMRGGVGEGVISGRRDGKGTTIRRAPFVAATAGAAGSPQNESWFENNTTSPN